MDIAREGSLMTFYRLADDENEESMSTALLRCLFRNLMFYQSSAADRLSGVQRASKGERTGANGSQSNIQFTELVGIAQEALSMRRDHMQRALLLAVKWNQTEFARRMLAELPGSDDYSRPLDKMLQHALELQRVEIVSLLLDRCARTPDRHRHRACPSDQASRRVQPRSRWRPLVGLGPTARPLSRCACAHPIRAAATTDVDISVAHGRPGCDVDAISLCQLYLQEDPYNFLRSDLALQTRLQRRLTDGTISRNHTYATYKEVVGPFLREVSPLLYSAIESATSASHLDLFFWAVFVGNVALARELWSHVDNPLHCALLASHVFKTMGDTITWGKTEVASCAPPPSSPCSRDHAPSPRIRSPTYPRARAMPATVRVPAALARRVGSGSHERTDERDDGRGMLPPHHREPSSVRVPRAHARPAHARRRPAHPAPRTPHPAPLHVRARRCAHPPLHAHGGARQMPESSRAGR